MKLFTTTKTPLRSRFGVPTLGGAHAQADAMAAVRAWSPPIT